MTQAQQVIEHISSLTVTEGEAAGENLRVLPWQKKFVRGAFAPGVEIAALSVARGNGKSTIISGIASAYIDGPLSRDRTEIVCLAGSHNQAKLIFEHILEFLGIREGDPRYRLSNSVNYSRLLDKARRIKLTCRGANAKSLHGIAPSLILLDEPAQIAANQRDQLLAAARTSLGKQPGAKLITLGTRSDDPGHFFNRLLGSKDKSVFSMSFSAPEGCGLSMAAVRKANPSLKYFEQLTATIKNELRQAKHDPAQEAEFRALRLNQGTSETVREVLLDYGVYQKTVCEELPGREGPLFIAIDAGSTVSMTAGCGFWPQSGRVEFLGAFAGEPAIEQREINDNVRGLYTAATRAGELVIRGSSPSLPIDEFILECVSRWGEPDRIIADFYRAKELQSAIEKAGIPVPLESRRAGYLTANEDIRDFRRSVFEERVSWRRSILFANAVRGARLRRDTSGNVKLAREGGGTGRSTVHRDDVASAAILAIAAGYRWLTTGGPPEAFSVISIGANGIEETEIHTEAVSFPQVAEIAGGDSIGAIGL